MFEIIRSFVKWAPLKDPAHDQNKLQIVDEIVKKNLQYFEVPNYQVKWSLWYVTARDPIFCISEISIITVQNEIAFN